MSDAASDPVTPLPGPVAVPVTKRPRDPEFWIAIGALAVSALAMLSSMLQFTVQRSQERAAAWPHLALATSYSSEAFTFVVQNKGMGPALVRHVEVRLDGKRVDGWTGVLNGLFGEGHPFDWSRIRATDVEDGVLAPGERVEVFSIPWNTGDAEDARAREGFSDASRFEVRACYCSVLGDCWITRESIDHAPVSACPAR
ncbi:MAG: hypothetical protein ACRC2H_14025 [Silanimonas sp.]